MNKDKILSDLIEEKNELKSYRYVNKEISKRISDIDLQIELIERGDSFREYELKENSVFLNNEDEATCFNDDDIINDDDYGFISENFNDPSKDY